MHSTPTPTKTQYRATCPACFAQQAIRPNGTMVQHGYRRPQDWHQNINTCAGYRHPHFGTAEGRAYTASLAERLRTQAHGNDVRAERVLGEREPVWGRKRLPGGYYMPVAIENPTAEQRASYARTLTAEAESLRRQAADFDVLVAAWQAAAPIAVPVEPKAEAPVHLRSNWYGFAHKACAGSAMGARRGYPHLTSEAAKVTCERCRRQMAARAARATK